VIGNIPIVSFDTSAHNRLVDDGPLSEPILAGLKSGLFFRFVGLSIAEMVATSDRNKRAALFTYCVRLQDGMTDCIQPHQEVTKRMILEHHNSPAAFAWKTVDVSGREYEKAIRRRALIDDDSLSAEEKSHLKARNKEYKDMWSNLHPELEEVFRRHGEDPPLTFREAVARSQREGSLILSIGKLLYNRAAQTDASASTMQYFIDACPPFRALIHAMLMSWYNLSVRDDKGERFEAGRNDMFMAVHLPYCDKFVTAEVYGEKQKCLREVALVAGLETEILSYDDFYNSFLVTA
jgi:hypothetical protein